MAERLKLFETESGERVALFVDENGNRRHISANEQGQLNDLWPGEAELYQFGGVINDIKLTAQELMGARSREDLVREFQQDQPARDELTMMNPQAASVGQMGLEIPAMFIPGGAPTQAAIGSVMASARFDPEEGEQWRRGLRAGQDAFAFGMAGRVVDRISKISEAKTAKAAQRLMDRDLRASFGERIGMDFVKATEEVLPGSATAGNAAQRQTALNRQFNAAIGATGDFVTDENIAARLKAAEQVYEGVNTQAGGIEMGEEFANIYRRTSKKFKQAAEEGKFPGMAKGQGGKIGEGEFMEIRQALADYGYSKAGSGDPFWKDALQLVEQMDDALQAKTNPAVREVFDRTREELRWLMASKGNNVINEGGDVSQKLLRNRVRKDIGFNFQTGAEASYRNPESVELVELVKDLSDPGVNPVSPQTGAKLAPLGVAMAADVAGGGGAATAGLAGVGLLSHAPSTAKKVPQTIVDMMLPSQRPFFERAGGVVGRQHEDALTQILFGGDQ